MSLTQESENNLQKTYPTPEILYEESPTAPFYLEINEKLLGELFQEIGMTPEQTSLTTVVVYENENQFERGRGSNNFVYFLNKIAGLPLPSAVALTRPDEKGFHYIHLNEQTVFKSLQDTMKFLSNFAKNNDKNMGFLNKIRKKWEEDSIKETIDSLFFTKRLSPYLKSTNQERVSKFLDRIFPLILHRYLIETLVHEGQHIYDIKNDRFFKVKQILPLFVLYLSATKTYDYLLAGSKDIDWISAGIASAFSFTLAWRTNQWIGIEARAGKKGNEMKMKSKYEDLVYIELNQPADAAKREK